MGGCCSCFDAIMGGNHDGGSGPSHRNGSSTEMTSRGGSKGSIPPPSHGLSRAMSAPTIRLQGFTVSGSGLALAKIPIEQDAAYWEWHVNLPGLPRHPDDSDEDDEGRMESINMDDNDDNDDNNNDPYALKFGVATRKDRHFYKSLENFEEEGDEASSIDDGTVLMRPISNLRHNDVIGVAVQQSDLPMIQFLLNGEPLPECTINRFRGTVYPAVYIPPGAVEGEGGGGGRIDDDEGISLTAEFDEDQFREMSPHARFGPLLAARVRSLTSHLQRNSVSFSVCSIGNHCSNCGDILSFTRGLTLALGSAVSSKFGRRLFDAFFCKESGYVDCAFIVAMYKSLVYAKLAYRNPRVIFLKILEEYTLNGDSTSDEDKKVEDVLKIISIAAITTDEYKFTSGLLGDEFTNSSENSIISRVELEKVFDKLPSVLYNFRLQLVHQMPSDSKLELLDALEDESLCVFIDASRRVGVKRMHAFRMRKLWNCFNGWRREVQYSNYVRQRIKRTALSAWKNEAHRLATARMLEEISVISCYKALIRRHFIKWRRLVLIKNRIQRICISEDIDKEVRSASGHLRIAARLIKLRSSHSTWVAFTLLERKVENAKCWHDRKITRSSMLALRQYSSRERNQRKRLREATIIQQRQLMRQRQQELELERSLHCNSSSKKWTSKQASMMRGSNEAKLQTRQLLSQKELRILETQRNLRRTRVAQRQFKMEKAFNSKWLMKQAEFLAAGTKRIQGWMKTVDYKILFEEQEKHYKNILSDRIDEDAERALSSDDVISYSILDALLSNAEVVPEIVFDTLPDPFDRLAFQNALEKEASLDTDQVYRIFEGLTGGQSESITKARLGELQRTSHRYLGLEGSQWKIFICSKSRQIILHNISSGQKITNIRKKHIQQGIRENIVSCENLKVRRAFYQRKKEAHLSMLEQHSAKIIQHMFRRWKRRELVNKKLWFVDRLRIKAAKEKEARAARVIQNVFRQNKLEMK